MTPEVTVVIPTRNRPSLVIRAVRSALAQTFTNLEVVVVVDGPDEETIASLSGVKDDRVRILALPESRGGGAARNAGTAAARGEWIGLLDDDDEWFPQKLERQLDVAGQSRFQQPIVFSQLRALTPHGNFIWPRRGPDPSEPIGDYLFIRSGPFQGDGLVQTSTIFAPKALLLQFPFRSELRRHQDWDWVLRVVRESGVGFEFVHEPLATWYFEENRSSVSSSQDWRYSWEWIKQCRALISARAYSAFVLTVLGPYAAPSGEASVFLTLLSDAFRCGRPRPRDVLLYVGMWTIPRSLRRRLRRAWTSERAGAAVADLPSFSQRR